MLYYKVNHRQYACDEDQYYEDQAAIEAVKMEDDAVLKESLGLSTR